MKTVEAVSEEVLAEHCQAPKRLLASTDDPGSGAPGLLFTPRTPNLHAKRSESR